MRKEVRQWNRPLCLHIERASTCQEKLIAGKRKRGETGKRASNRANRGVIESLSQEGGKVKHAPHECAHNH
jgi:hypothetical protein